MLLSLLIASGFFLIGKFGRKQHHNSMARLGYGTRMSSHDTRLAPILRLIFPERAIYTADKDRASTTLRYRGTTASRVGGQKEVSRGRDGAKPQEGILSGRTWRPGHRERPGLAISLSLKLFLANHSTALLTGEQQYPAKLLHDSFSICVSVYLHQYHCISGISN